MIKKYQIKKWGYLVKCLICKKKFYANRKNCTYCSFTCRSIGVRKYRFNESYFYKIDNENKAYWRGFILAEGHITKYLLKVELKHTDGLHLRKMIKDLNGNQKIVLRIKKPSNSYSVCFNSIILCKDLSKPIRIPLKLQRHFWRGMIDGDGSIYRRNLNDRKHITWYVSLSNKVKWLKKFRKFINRKDTKIEDRITHGQFCVGGNIEVRRILKLLYDNSTIFLDRKKKLYYEMLKNVDIKKYWTRKYKIDKCISCGSNKIRHEALGYCKTCYHTKFFGKEYYEKRK